MSPIQRDRLKRLRSVVIGIAVACAFSADFAYQYGLWVGITLGCASVLVVFVFFIYYFSRSRASRDRYFADTGVKKYVASLPTTQLQYLAPGEPTASEIPDWGSGNAGGSLLIGNGQLVWEPSKRLADKGAKAIAVSLASIASCSATSGNTLPPSAYLSVTLMDGRSLDFAVTDKRDLLTVLEQSRVPLSVSH